MPNRRPRAEGAAVDPQADRRAQIEAAIQWIQTRELVFKRIAALASANGVVRGKRNRS
jgi:hypothetical protein